MPVNARARQAACVHAVQDPCAKGEHLQELSSSAMLESAGTVLPVKLLDTSYRFCDIARAPAYAIVTPLPLP